MSETRGRNLGVLGLLVLSTAFTFACTRAPDKKIEDATSALENAKKSEAEAYAKSALDSAEEAYSDAMAEVEEQNQRIPFFRSYDRASELLSEAMKSAGLAKTRAVERREEMKRYADGLIEDAESAVTTARDAVTNLGRRIEPGWNTDLETADRSLSDARHAWEQKQYLVARDKAQDAKAKADEVLERASSRVKHG